ncbi:MAG: hypothetical protein QOJ01_386 [Solirubrobacterales bacterium]|nr:hypothetical protein [Solirubrobacterales bacterium]
MIRRRAILASGAACAVTALALPGLAQAHILEGRKDLPIPAWLFAWGASIVLIISFFVLSVAWTTQRLETVEWRPIAPRLSRALASRAASVLFGAIGVFLLGVAVWAGLYGIGTPDLNFSLTFIFVTAWVGLAFLSVLFGNVFRAFNPWRAVACAFRWFLRKAAGTTPSPPLRYPEKLGRWPAAVGIASFVWMELVYSTSGFQAVGVEPRAAAIAVLVYSAYTLVAMGLFGVETWLQRGEAFSVYYEMFSQLSPLEMRDGRLGRRRPLAAASHWASVPGSIAMTIVAIGGTTFDGAQEGVLRSPIISVYNRFQDIGLGSTFGFRLDETLFLLLCFAFVATIFWLGVRGMHLVRGSPPTRQLGGSFVHTLIPIALAYLTAHYFSLFVFQEQAQFTYLLSNPLGNGSNYFGTANAGVDYGLIGTTGVWYVQVAALLAGHITGLALAHDRALGIYPTPRLASLSQRWMLIVMVAFTCFGLFLLSQSNA